MTKKNNLPRSGVLQTGLAANEEGQAPRRGGKIPDPAALGYAIGGVREQLGRVRPGGGGGVDA
jgi:hypothetical protein